MEDFASQAHHLIDVISVILVFFGISGVVVPLMHHVKVSPVLGYLICGIIVGPFGIAQIPDLPAWVSRILITDTSTVHVLGELGIIALMFMIGLELSFDRLKELRRYIFGLGSMQILLTGAVIFGFGAYFGNSNEASILLGASLALSSTAIVMKLLEEKKISNTFVGILCFSVLLMQDLAVVPILVLASSFSGGAETSIVEALVTSLLVGIVTVLFIYWLGKKILTPLFKSVSVSSSSEWLIAFVVFLVLACSTLTYMAGLSLALGAFIAGLLVADTEFKHEVEVMVSPLKGMLLGVFFLSVGMMINFVEVLTNPLMLFASVLGLFALKGVIIFALCRAFRLPARQSAEASIFLAQPGEFALMILGVALAAQIMPVDDVQFFLLVTVLSMMATPLLFKLAPIAANVAHSVLGEKDEKIDPSAIMVTKKNVVIAGFGRVGQLIGNELAQQQIPYVAIEHDGKKVQALRKQNFNVVYGDVRKKEIWHHLISENIEAAIIAIDDKEATKFILKSLRAEFPLLTVIARSKDAAESDILYDEGADHVVEETREASLKIVEIVMDGFDDELEEQVST